MKLGPPKKVIFLDVETTGLIAKKNDIVQFSAIIEYDGVVVDSIDIKMQPENYRNVSLRALDVQGKTIEDLKSYMSARDGYFAMANFIDSHVDRFCVADKLFPIGYNVNFDISFLEEKFKKNGDSFLFSRIGAPIDVLPVVRMLSGCGKIKGLQNHRLETVCLRFGIEIQAHDSSSDVAATRALYRLICSRVFI